MIPADTRVSDTASLILLWAENAVHTSAYSRSYTELLNLDFGRDLFTRCNAVWPHYGEVIKNRKHCIRNAALRSVQQDGATQVAVFGSGMDALSLDVAASASNVTVYEIDTLQMSLKRKIIRMVSDGLADSIKCITADLQNASRVVAEMRKAGWDRSLPSVLVFEGISYFLPEEDLWNLISKFRRPDRGNAVLLEYLLHRHLIAPDRACVPERIFETIQRCSQDHIRGITRYGIDDVQRQLAKLNGRVTKKHTMKDMEVGRTGRNKYFKTDESGWIEICCIDV